MGAAGAGVLVASLAAIDGRVRDFIASLLATDAASHLDVASFRSQQLARAVSDAMSFNNESYGPLAVFAAVGVVFLILMFKS